MAVDIRRSGARQAMRIYRGSTDTVTVRWYRCLPSANTLPFPTAIDAASIWESREWSKNRPIGEAVRWGTATIDDVQGKPLGRRPCGNPAWFVLGVPPASRDDRDCRCVPYQNLGDVATQGEWSATRSSRWTGTGDVVTEGVWSARWRGPWVGTGDVVTEGVWSARWRGPWAGTGDVVTEGVWSARWRERWTGAGEVVTEGEWSLAANDCTAWIHSEANGMTFTEESPWTVRFDAQDSTNCGGPNDTIQFGSATHCFDLTEDGFVTLTLSGLTEREDEGFDAAHVYMDGVEVASIGSTGELLGCAMGGHTATVTVPAGVGRHNLTLTANTIDARFHVGAFWRLDVVFPGGWIGTADVVTEGEWTVPSSEVWVGMADTVTEGEWSMRRGTGWIGTADMVMEGEWSMRRGTVWIGTADVVTEGEL